MDWHSFIISFLSDRDIAGAAQRSAGFVEHRGFDVDERQRGKRRQQQDGEDEGEGWRCGLCRFPFHEEGRLMGTCLPKHRHQEWIQFLKMIDEKTPPDVDLHLIVDNYSTHKHLRVRSWLKRHPRFHIHFIPTSSSWLNLIERWFREITEKRILRGVFHNVPELIKAIMTYIDQHNQNPKSFVWTAKAETILQKIQRARRMLDKYISA
jgi:transposase